MPLMVQWLRPWGLGSGSWVPHAAARRPRAAAKRTCMLQLRPSVAKEIETDIFLEGDVRNIELTLTRPAFKEDCPGATATGRYAGAPLGTLTVGNFVFVL